MNDLQVINPHPTILILQSEANLTVPPKQFSTEHIYPNNQNQQSSSSLNIKILPEIKSSNSLSLKFFWSNKSNFISQVKFNRYSTRKKNNTQLRWQLFQPNQQLQYNSSSFQPLLDKSIDNACVLLTHCQKTKFNLYPKKYFTNSFYKCNSDCRYHSMLR